MDSKVNNTLRMQDEKTSVEGPEEVTEWELGFAYSVHWGKKIWGLGMDKN